MCQFVETIRVKDGELINLSYHQKRFEKTLLFLKCGWCCALEDILKEKPFGPGVFKARVVYDVNGIKEVEFVPYRVRYVQSLKLVHCDDIEYSFKSTNRSLLNELALQKDDADEVIIVKHGMLTDTSYSNIALFDGEKWVTPRFPLLKGTMRQSLLDQGVLIEKDIKEDEISRFEKVSLINAMMPLGICECSLIKP